MNGAGFRVVDDKKIKDKRQRRGIPELEEGPEQRHSEENRFGEFVLRSPSTGISIGYHLLQPIRGKKLFFLMHPYIQLLYSQFCFTSLDIFSGGNRT